MLAYAGAILPLLLVIADRHLPTNDALNLQSIAEPAIAAAVGCIALIAAVPFTPGLAAALIAKIPSGRLPHHRHSH